MTNEQIVNGLTQLGFNSGWVVSNEEIILWENDAPQPSEADILAASNLWDEQEGQRQKEAAAQKQALLAKLGITEDEAKLLLS